MTHPAKRERNESDPIKQRSTWVNAQLLWGCDAWNATPEAAARQLVADLYTHLSRGGSVQVRVTGMDGEGYTVEVTARRQ
jgi:hypothetical protein